jgi:hypothetical protein
VPHQTSRKEANAGGQFAGERSTGLEFFDDRGRGTEGGDVVQRSAAKYRHNAGPG